VVVETRGEVVGFCRHGPSRDSDAGPSTGEVVAINVDPAAWRQGRTDLPVPTLRALVEESERAGFRLVRRLVEDWATGANRFDGPGEALFVASVDGHLGGICGLNVDPYCAEARVGRVRHPCVLSEFRRHGVGRRLVTEIIGTARGSFDTLRLRTGNPAPRGSTKRSGSSPREKPPQTPRMS